MRRLFFVACALSCGCVIDPPDVDGDDPDAGLGVLDAADASSIFEDTGAREDAGEDSGTVEDASEVVDSGDVEDSGSPEDADVVSVCDPASPAPPPASLGTVWNEAVLSVSGAEMLGGHGHDDGRPPIGFCAAPRVPGRRVWWLRSIRFETDEDLDGDGNHDPLPRDDRAANAIYDAYGMGESGGRHHVYAELLDASGARVAGAIEVDFGGGMTMQAATDPGKPPDEFPINVAIWGGNVLNVRVSDPNVESDAVTNLRIPNNHHVDFLLIFQEATP